MTDYLALAKRMDDMYHLDQPPEEFYAAADAIRAQARRIAELESMISVHRLAVDVDALKARIADLEADCAILRAANFGQSQTIDGYAARIAELEATIRKFQKVEKALNYFLDKDTPYTWRYRRDEAEELARAALGEKND
jgi:uncharacterized coiled-coil protein SlyX